MKFKNTQKIILPLDGRDSVGPYAVTRDFSEKEVEASIGLQQVIKRGILIPYDGPEPTVEKASSPRTATWDVEMSSGKAVQHKTPNGIVEYVVSDTEGADNVLMHDADTVTSLAGRRSADYIEEGVSANAYNKSQPRNASEAYDRQVDEENAASDFDDEENLAENESEREGVLDVDQEIARDATQMLVKNGKAGSSLHDVSSLVQREVTSAMGAVDRATRPSYDDGELQAGAPAHVVDFLKQNFTSKKWALSKESDPSFLENIIKVTKSENVKTLAEQRLSELKKA